MDDIKWWPQQHTPVPPFFLSTTLAAIHDSQSNLFNQIDDDFHLRSFVIPQIRNRRKEGDEKKVCRLRWW